MKAKFIYDLNEPDECMAMLRAAKSIDLCLVILDIKEALRSEAKYNDNAEADRFATDLSDIMDRHNINLDELIE